MAPPLTLTPIELDDRELDSLERLEGKRKIPSGNVKDTRRVHECIKRLFSHPQSYGLQKIRYTGEAMQKYACRSDYDRYAQAVNKSVHTMKDYRPYRPTDAAYRCAVLDDVSRYLHNDGFDMTPRLEEALVTEEQDLELEIENAELLCKKEEADVRSLQKNRRKDPFVHLMLRPDRLQKRAAELTGNSEAMVTSQAAREFLRILIEWTRKVVQDVLVVEEQFRIGRPRAPLIGWDSVAVSLEMNGFSEEMIENVKRSTIGSKKSKLDDSVDGESSRITDSSEMREFLCEFGKTVADALENVEIAEAEGEANLDFSEALNEHELFESSEVEEEVNLDFSKALNEHELLELSETDTEYDDIATKNDNGVTKGDKDEDDFITEDEGSLSFIEDDNSLPSFKTAIFRQGGRR